MYLDIANASVSGQKTTQNVNEEVTVSPNNLKPHVPIENHLKEKISKNDPAPEVENNEDDEDSEYDPASKSLYSSDSEDIDIEKNNQLKEFDSTLSVRWEKYLLSPGGGSEKPRDARHHTG